MIHGQDGNRTVHGKDGDGTIHGAHGIRTGHSGSASIGEIALAPTLPCKNISLRTTGGSLGDLCMFPPASPIVTRRGKSGKSAPGFISLLFIMN